MSCAKILSGYLRSPNSLCEIHSGPLSQHSYIYIKIKEVVISFERYKVIRKRLLQTFLNNKHTKSCTRLRRKICTGRYGLKTGHRYIRRNAAQTVLLWGKKDFNRMLMSWCQTNDAEIPANSVTCEYIEIRPLRFEGISQHYLQWARRSNM